MERRQVLGVWGRARAPSGNGHNPARAPKSLNAPKHLAAQGGAGCPLNSGKKQLCSARKCHVLFASTLHPGLNPNVRGKPCFEPATKKGERDSLSLHGYSAVAATWHCPLLDIFLGLAEVRPKSVHCQSCRIVT